MDYGTKLALRAIVSGLHHAGTIDQRHVSEIVKALATADAEHADRLPIQDRIALRELCMDVARDGQVECSIHKAEPDLRMRL